MPSAVPVLTGLTFDSVDLQDFPRVFLQIVSGGPDDSPETRGANSRTPYRDGQLYGPKREDRLVIMLEGFVSGTGTTEATARSDTATARAELRTLFDPTAAPATLAVTTEDGTDWTIDAYTESILWADLTSGIPTHRTVSVRLIAIDPPHWTAS